MEDLKTKVCGRLDIFLDDYQKWIENSTIGDIARYDSYDIIQALEEDGDVPDSIMKNGIKYQDFKTELDNIEDEEKRYLHVMGNIERGTLEDYLTTESGDRYDQSWYERRYENAAYCNAVRHAMSAIRMFFRGECLVTRCTECKQPINLQKTDLTDEVIKQIEKFEELKKKPDVELSDYEREDLYCPFCGKSLEKIRYSIKFID